MKRAHCAYALLFVLSILVCLTTINNVIKKSAKENSNQEICITVFVHGIVGITPHLNIKNIVNLVLDDVLDTEYALAVELTRGDPFFCQLQPINQLGLILVDKTIKEPNAAVAAAILMDSFEKQIHQEVNHKNYYYTFGWSGLATHSARMHAAKQLYYALDDLVKHYRQSNNGVNLKLRVIGYSHGGNVVLNLGAVKPLNYQQHSFFIDELVLLGTPILCESDLYVQSRLFKNIFHIYSRGDRVQFVDCFSYKRFFSNKIFTERSGLKLPKNLKQIQVSVTDRIKTRSNNTTIDERIKRAIDPAVITGSARFLRDKSYSHLELWYFGWVPKGYRKKNIMYPLPMCSLLPFILHAEKTYGPITSGHSLIVDLRPRYGQLITRQEYQYERRLILPFLSFDQIEEYKKFLLSYWPKNITEKIQYDHVYQWCDIAQKEFKSRRKKKKKKRKRKHKLRANIDIANLCNIAQNQ